MISNEPIKPTEPTLSQHSIVLMPDSSHADTLPLLLTNKFISHNPKSGLNPLADAAAYLFSIIGKLKQLKSYRHIDKLQKELMTEINIFQDTAKAHGYGSEYLLVSRYAICATFDDIIANTVWGAQGQWENYSLLNAFNQDAQQNQERFFIILERIIKDETLYIDLMEFMYICLSLGFKGQYRASEFGLNQLEQITHTLYRRIRSTRGEFNKTLSPFPIKVVATTKSKKIPSWIIILLTVGIIFSLFVGLGYMLDTISNQAYQELMRIGKSILYETHAP